MFSRINRVSNCPRQLDKLKAPTNEKIKMELIYMQNSNDKTAEKIVSQLRLNHCHALINKTDYELMLYKEVQQIVDSILIKKQGMPVRIWAEFNGPLKLFHYTTREAAEEIAYKGFDKSKYSSANFDPHLTGLYCVRADCPHGWIASTIVRSDYPEYTHKIELLYDGHYYLTINHIEEYILIPISIPKENIIDISKIN